MFTNAVQAETGTVCWETSTPEEQGMDSGVLNELKDHIKGNYPDIISMVIIRNGFLVEEEYFDYSDTTKRNIYSCTKSFTSTLIGIAIHEGYIDSINESVLDFFPNHTFTNVDERKQNMTLYHLLTMTAGLEWVEGEYNPNDSFIRMTKSTDWVQFVLDLEMVAHPGETFNYNTGAYHVMSAIINYTTGMSTLEFAKSRLFDPLGIEDYIWQKDPSGIHRGGDCLWLTPRSLAKLGQLYLDNGSWKGQQIVPEEWVYNSTGITTPPEETTYPEGYGWGWWIHTDISYEGAFSAWGRGHQRVIVYTKYQVVATFTSAMFAVSSALDPVGNLVNTFVLPAIFTHDNYRSSTESTDSTNNAVTAFAFTFPILLVIVIIRKNRWRK